MSENSTETTTAKAPRCGVKTASGPCARPAGHNTGHTSQAVLDRKAANAKGKDLTPDALRAAEALRAQAAADRIAAAEQAHADRVAKLEAAAAALGYKLTPMTAKDKKTAAAAE
jgi:hypothetical protein